MARGPLYSEQYRPQFSGHETFPLRYGWLHKAYEAIRATSGEPGNRAVFSDDAIARFGVGRNMVASMRHWANAAGIIEEERGGSIRPAPLGEMLFGRGIDPYIEQPASLWLIHWHLCARPEKTTWFWAFNHFPATTFEREHLVRGLDRLAKDRGWQRAAATTIKNDVACFIRTYAADPSAAGAGNEDKLESPLTELGLIKAVRKRDGFRFARGPKSTLGDGVFVYALIDFWSRYNKAATLSLEAIAHEPGSPGRVFLLDENDVVDRLVVLDDFTKGAFRWSETAGLKQVVRDTELKPELALKFAEKDFGRTARRAAA
ncbi:DUF4007 family protein [Rhodopseudomonas pseudopalustris]|uniref:DUF4007 family protein n=1 Tax=Rhodopseudomonas pseudopalustris TaxID=1513892 RepID=UPI003F971551